MKVHNTRKQRAARLRQRLTQGPSFSAPFDGSPFTVALATEQFRNWSQSWILGELESLVPELKRPAVSSQATAGEEPKQ